MARATVEEITQELLARTPGPCILERLVQAPFPQVHIVQSTLCSHTDVSLQLVKTCLITQMPIKAFYVKPSPTAQGQECRPLLDTDGHHLLVFGWYFQARDLASCPAQPISLT